MVIWILYGYFENVRGSGPTLLDVFALFRGFAHGIFGPEKKQTNSGSSVDQLWHTRAVIWISRRLLCFWVVATWRRRLNGSAASLCLSRAELEKWRPGESAAAEGLRGHFYPPRCDYWPLKIKKVRAGNFPQRAADFNAATLSPIPQKLSPFVRSHLFHGWFVSPCITKVCYCVTSAGFPPPQHYFHGSRLTLHLSPPSAICFIILGT